MITNQRSRPATIIVLLCLLIFLGISALPAGAGLALDPSGASLGMTTELLQTGPFTSFLIPGLFLFLVLGVWSLVVAYALWRRVDWPLPALFFGWMGCHWTWGAALVQGIVLMAWIVIQVAITGPSSLLQPLYFSIGIVIALLCLRPSARAYCA